MSADGELYLDEDCRDYFRDELDKAFGKDKWNIDAGDYSDCWDLGNFPKVAEVKIKDDETDKLIGTALITSRFEIEEEAGRYIQPYPDKIEIKKEEVSLVEAMNKDDKKKIKEIVKRAMKGEVVRVM